MTICQSVIWNTYNCLCHFFLAINMDRYIKFFGIPAFLFFANFSIFEIKLLYIVWRNQNLNNLFDTFEVRRKLMRFYVVFYIFIFLCLFWVTKFYFIKSYIFVAILFTWLPQIYFNYSTKNKISLPILNVVLMSLNKISIPVIFY